MASKEKIYDIPITSPLTLNKRKVIDKYITGNARLNIAAFNITVSHEWHKDDDVLFIKTPPVHWEIIFDGKNVEVYGVGPLWARLLFTEKKRILLREQITLLLHETGFLAKKPKGVKPAAGIKRPRQTAR
jgi:hypothetical protein